VTLVLFLGGVLVTFAVFLYALLKAAGDADRRIEQRADRLAEVESLNVARAKREARNGLGRVGKAS
jgi:hypothetical protein